MPKMSLGKMASRRAKSVGRAIKNIPRNVKHLNVKNKKDKPLNLFKK